MSSHKIDQGVLATLERVKNRIDYALDEYENPEATLRQVEFNIRQSIHALRHVRKLILHSGDYR